MHTKKNQLNSGPIFCSKAESCLKEEDCSVLFFKAFHLFLTLWHSRHWWIQLRNPETGNPIFCCIYQQLVVFSRLASTVPSTDSSESFKFQTGPKPTFSSCCCTQNPPTYQQFSTQQQTFRSPLTGELLSAPCFDALARGRLTEVMKSLSSKPQTHPKWLTSASTCLPLDRWPQRRKKHPSLALHLLTPCFLGNTYFKHKFYTKIWNTPDFCLCVEVFCFILVDIQICMLYFSSFIQHLYRSLYQIFFNDW